MQKFTFLQALLLTVGFATFAATGCSDAADTLPFERCQVDQDCDGEGMVCRSGVCSQSCDNPSDCADGEVCDFGGICVSPCEVDGEDSSCPSAQSCVEGTEDGDICWWDDADQQPETCDPSSDQNSCSGAQYCASGYCISNACEEMGDCQGRFACSAGICQRKCVADGESPERLQCPEGQRCNPRTERCESAECTAMDCSDQFKECNPGDTPCDKFCCYDGTCDPDSPNADSVCQFYAEENNIEIPQVCTDNGVCENAPECMQDSDCESNEICEIKEGERNVCRRGCRCTDGCEKDCGVRQVCSFQMGEAGTCVDGCSTNEDCDFQGEGSGEAYCVDDQCIDSCDSSMDCETEGFACRTFEGSTSQEQTVCQHCRQDADCGSANDREFCDTSQGINEEFANNDSLGLCRDLPALCPDDGFGQNFQRGADAFLLDDSKFSGSPENKTFSDTPVFCSQYGSQGDWFQLPGDQIGNNQVIDITVTYPQEIDGGDTGNVDLALYREGESEPIVTSTGPDDGGTERIVYGVQAASTFEIQIRGGIIQHPDPETGRSKQFVNYDLEVEVRDPKPCNSQNDDSLEGMDGDNDSQATAVEVAPGMEQTDLTVCGDDPDYYSLGQAQENQNLDILVDAPFNLGDVTVSLYKDGTKVTEARTDNDTERLRYSTDDGANLVVGVTVENGTGLINYDFQWSQSPNQCYDSLEPNNQCPPFGEPSDVLGNYSNAGPSYLKRGDYTGSSYNVVATDLRVCDGSPENSGNGSDTYAIYLFPGDTVKAKFYEPIGGRALSTIIMQEKVGNSCVRYQTDTVTQENGNDVRTFDEEVSSGGWYYFSVGKVPSPGALPYNFELYVDPAPPCNDDDLEPNDNPYAMDPTFTSLSRANVIDGGDDAAWLDKQICDSNSDAYCITDVQQGDDVRFEVNFEHDVGDLDAFLLDPSGSTVAMTGVGTTDDDNETVEVKGAQAGKYCLRVQGDNPQRNNYDVLAYVNDQGPDNEQCPDRFEPNDSCAAMSCNATQVSPGTESGLVSCTGNADWYQTQVGSGETLSVDAPTSGGNTVTVDIFSEDNLSSPVATTSSGAATYTSNKDQTVYYRITTGADRAFYDLNVSISGPVPCTDDRFESPGNDTPGNATQVTAPGQILNLRKCNGNEDWYEVTLNKDELFRVSLLHKAQSPDPTVETGDLDLEFYEPASGGGTPTLLDSSTSMSAPETLEYTYTGSNAQKTFYVKVVSPENARLDYDLQFATDTNDDGQIDGSDNWPAGNNCPDQFEENDSGSDAQELAGRKYTGLTMCSNGGMADEDFYSFFVPESVTLDATVSKTSTTQVGELKVEIYDQNPDNTSTAVTSGTADDSSDASLSVTNSNAGTTYYIKVTDGGQGATFLTDYSIDLKPSFPMSCNEDTLGNIDGSSSASGTPKTLSSGTEYDGSNSLKLCEDTEDWFEFTPSMNGTATFGIAFKGSLGGISIEILDSSGNRVGTVSSPTASTNVQQASASVTAGNTYNVRVYPTGGAFVRNDYDFWASLPGSAPSEPWCPDRYERNDIDSVDGVYDLTRADVQWGDAIVCGSENDWYSVSLTGGTTYYIDAFFDHASDRNVDMELRDTSGNVVQDTDGNDISFMNSSMDDDEQAVFKPGSTETFRLGFTKSSATEVLAPFQIATDANFTQSGCVDDKYEPNNNFANRKSLSSSAPFAESLGMCDSVDQFSWTASSDGTVELQVLLDESKHGVSLQVENASSGSNVLTASRDGNMPDNRIGGSFSVTAQTTYNIDIAQGTVNGSPAFGPYFLRVTQTSSP